MPVSLGCGLIFGYLVTYHFEAPWRERLRLPPSARDPSRSGSFGPLACSMCWPWTACCGFKDVLGGPDGAPAEARPEASESKPEPTAHPVAGHRCGTCIGCWTFGIVAGTLFGTIIGWVGGIAGFLAAATIGAWQGAKVGRELGAGLGLQPPRAQQQQPHAPLQPQACSQSQPISTDQALDR